MLIVIEGLDGSGKGTQAERLADELVDKGLRVRRISFPNYNSQSSALVKMYLGGEFGLRPDDVNAYAASSFYAVDRYASFKKDWREDYINGIVIADRYTTSNAIHQCSKLPKDQWDQYLNWLFHFEYQLLEIPEPTLVIYLQVDPAVSQTLLMERYENEDKRDIHEKDIEYLNRCQEAAWYCSQKLGWKTVDCCREGVMRSVNEIHKEICTAVGVL